MSNQGRLMAIIVCVATLLCNSAFALDVENRRCSFQIRIPDNFTAYEVDASEPDAKAITARYFDREPSPSDPALGIQMMQLPCEIDPSARIKAENLAKTPGQETTLEIMRWHSLELQILRTICSYETQDIPEMVVYTIGFPSRNPANALQVAGPLEKDAEVYELFHNVTQSYYDLNPRKALTVAEAQEQELRKHPGQSIEFLGMHIIALGAFIATIGGWIKKSIRKMVDSDPPSGRLKEPDMHR